MTPRPQHKIPMTTEMNAALIKDLYLENGVDRLVRQGLSSTPNTASGITNTKKMRGFQMEEMTLTAVGVEIDEANDYASVKLCDLPTSNIIILGCLCDVTCTVDGTVITDPEDIDYAVGTVALTSTDFSNSGEQNILAEADVAALGVMQNVTTATELDVILTKTTNALYLNIQATIATTATQTFNGTITLFYVDLGAES